MDLQDALDRLFRSKKNNIRPTRNQLRVPRNNIRSGPLTTKGMHALVDSWENYVISEDFKKAKRVWDLVGKARRHRQLLQMSPLGLAATYAGAAGTAIKTGRDAKNTRKKNKEQLFMNINKPLPPVQMPNARPFSPEMYAP
jgi:hypothetical protein